MKMLVGVTSALLTLGWCGTGLAQDSATTEILTAPKVLVIQREFVKPGRSGGMHEKSEAAFVSAVTAAKWKTHYIAADSMSGRPRSLFMFGYQTFLDWEKDNQAMEKNAVLMSAIEKAAVTDGDLLTDSAQSVFVLDSDNSLRPGDAVHARYFEITQFKVKPGHRAEWKDLVKMYHDGLEAAVPTAHWALYESQYGENNGGYYVAISAMKSLQEDDESMNDDKKFAESMGPEKMKKLAELTAACLDSSQTNLFQINPRMSYAADEWIKADAFWTPKKELAGGKKVTSGAKKSETATVTKPSIP